MVYGESLELARQVGLKEGTAMAPHSLGDLALAQGDGAAAVARYRESLALVREMGHKQGLAHVLGGLAKACASRGDGEGAARLFGFVEALRAELGLPPEPEDDRAELDGALAGLCARLGEERFASGRAEGGGLPLDAAVALALDATGDGEPG